MSSKLSKTSQVLMDKLIAIYDDRDFVIGVMTNASHEDDRQTIIEYIDKGKDVTVDQLILLSLHLNIERKKIKAS